jgi:5-hydroxyisourate hydrolase-like protein (transthyretin family)
MRFIESSDDMNAPGFFPLVGIGSRESLKQRLEHVLSGVRIAPGVGRHWIVGASLLALTAIAGVSFAQQRNAAAEFESEPAVSAGLPGPHDAPKRALVQLPSREEHGDDMTVRGQVLQPDGKPAAGAKVSARRTYWTSNVKWRPLAATIADAEGRFELSYRRSQLVDEFSMPVEHVTIAAQAEAFGVQWTPLDEIDAHKPLVLRLVPDLPVRGRVVDLEGRPVEGARVRLLQIRAPKVGEDLGPWLEAVKLGAMTNGLSAKLGTILPGIDDDSQPPIITDREGHFTFRGIGAERDVRFELGGETIASQQFDVATREMKPLKRRAWFSITDQVFGATFTIEAPPTKPIVGTVRDRATGKPLAGVRVESQNLPGMLFYPRNALQTQTDAEGRFRLVGMPKDTKPSSEPGNLIRFVPNDDQPFLVRTVAVPDTPGLDPVRLDVDLRRGQWITGRVTDKATGKPVFSRIEYFPWLKNPFATPPEFASHDERFHTRPDGSYRLLGLPGRGIVGVSAVGGLYRTGVGAAEIADLNKNGGFQNYFNDPSPQIYSALKEINPAAGAQTDHCDFVLDPGQTIHIRLVDRAGQPVSGVDVLGESGEGRLRLSLGPAFDVVNLVPHERRKIEIYQRERQIGKHLDLNYDEKTPRTMTVTLEPCATVVGRLVDAEGVPIQGVEIHTSPTPGSWPWMFTPIVTSRTDGRFECRGLYPGCDYALAVAVPGNGNDVNVQFLRSGLVIEPGKTIDLGNLKLKR